MLGLSQPELLAVVVAVRRKPMIENALEVNDDGSRRTGVKRAGFERLPWVE